MNLSCEQPGMSHHQYNKSDREKGQRIKQAEPGEGAIKAAQEYYRGGYTPVRNGIDFPFYRGELLRKAVPPAGIKVSEISMKVRARFVAHAICTHATDVVVAATFSMQRMIASKPCASTT